MTILLGWGAQLHFTVSGFFSSGIETRLKYCLQFWSWNFFFPLRFLSVSNRVSVRGVKSLGGHFACLCRGFEFYEVRNKNVIIFQKENGNTFTLLIFFYIEKSSKRTK